MQPVFLRSAVRHGRTGVCRRYQDRDEHHRHPPRPSRRRRSSLTFDKLEETVRQNNVTIKANNNTVLSAEKTDVSDQYIESYFQLSEQISSYQKQIKELQKTLKELGTDEANAGLRKTLESQISILQRNLAAAEASYRNLDDDEDDAEEDQEKTVDHTRRQMQNAADEICLSAENTYISLRGMKYTLNQTNRQHSAA